MKFKTYLGVGVLSVLFILIIITLVRLPNDSNDNKEKSVNSEVNTEYTKDQYEKAEKRKDYENKLDDKIKEYIVKTNAPKNQDEYDEALSMRSVEDQKSLARNVSDLIKDKERAVNDIYTNVSFDNKSELSGEYEYTLTYKNNDEIVSENKQGEFTIKTNDDGYFYIDQFD